MKQWLSLSLAVVLFVTPLLTACTNDVSTAASALRTAPQSIPFTQFEASPIAAAQTFTTTPYLEQLNIPLDGVKYLPLVEQTLALNTSERDALARNGFVVSDRIRWQRFIEAYAWIYWKDLPVLVTTDSLLHAFHQSYDDLLQELELSILTPQLAALLTTTRATLATQQQANPDPALDPLYRDVDVYLAVAYHLLQGSKSDDPAVAEYVKWATDANVHAEIPLFGTKRAIDFTLFKPRAHYADNYKLETYFRAMNWLAQIDFRFVAYDPLTNIPILDQSQMAAAAILRNAIDDTDQRLRWQVINGLLELLIGRSDNMTLPDFDRFLTDATITTPGQLLTADGAALLTLLTTNDYGQQRITGQLIERHADNPSDQPIPRPTSFLLLGQRFAIDSFVFSELVYDRLMVDGKPIHRALPDPLDVMAALGNPRALTHLQSELATYQYTPQLTQLQQSIAALPAAFWRAPVYNQWLGLLRTLNTPTTEPMYPKAMRTAAWADKMLQTQLGSWTQLRHDNMLYVKQSFTPSEVTCEYPAGYVEPYPAFYAALAQLAQDVQQVLAAVPLAPTDDGVAIRAKIVAYLENLAFVSTRLQQLAEKELRLEAFTEQEELFLKSMIKREARYIEGGCAGPEVEERWDGWYAHLFYKKDNNPALIADVHTNATNDPRSALYPPRVLHAATGPVAAALLVVDTDEGMALYVGPAFTYFEVVAAGSDANPPERLNNDQWRKRLQSNPYPTTPTWTQSFRLAVQSPPKAQTLPVTSATQNPPVTKQQSLFLPLIQQENK
ncbi:MAG: DUF3160 domain-containing protein [Caldilinea sp. CFX5]|nr:DUF3160 domain-containing protein [Caldilinea sp. CFX5]